MGQTTSSVVGGRQQYATVESWSQPALTSDSSMIVQSQENDDDDEEPEEVRPLMKLTPRQFTFAQKRYGTIKEMDEWTYQDLIDHEKQRMDITTHIDLPSTITYQKNELTLCYVGELNFQQHWKEGKIEFPILFFAEQDIDDQIRYLHDSAIQRGESPPSTIYVSKWAVPNKIMLAKLDPTYCLWDLERFLQSKDPEHYTHFHLNLLGDGLTSEIADYMEQNQHFRLLDGWINLLALPTVPILQSYMLFGRTVNELQFNSAYQYKWNSETKKYHLS